ncbi:4-(cytidine 5'-diphospho)-2-C-methyl-D-erythritol kinase [Allorhizocola rhizosphaerae]|uniref:4-(cytidine 5'-diphospho)-2-C-methyl-D-erythritol kinase n=1 Tax=Allorhizocola rhizosphaerae TaxID=1872709 RepID=UPI000E3BD761|nr:4-(cytidine 5'-diphospho)-2-C-methyl-D-erythritol kinase [Allorhizocola rhizosphaerae]
MTEAWALDQDGQLAVGPVRVRVPAKINLHLGVGPLRPDGYHELHTVYHAVSLYDEITARAGDALTLTMQGEGVGEIELDDRNLVIRAARALAAAAKVEPKARLHLRKQIPIAAGLAGGSADAAATLVACDSLWDTGFSRADLADIAATLGSDVPFLLYGGTALGTGRGETVNPVLARATRWHWVIAFSAGGLSTPDVYRELDRLRASGKGGAPLGSTDGLLAALRQRDPAALGAVLGNDLQAAAVSLMPQLETTLQSGRDAGAHAALVSGSGPTCVFLADDEAHAGEIADAVREHGDCREVQLAHGPVPGARVG